MKIIFPSTEISIRTKTIIVQFVCNSDVAVTIFHEMLQNRIYHPSSIEYLQGPQNDELNFVKPFYFTEGTAEFKMWEKTMNYIENQYLQLIEMGNTPEQASVVLPRSLAVWFSVSLSFNGWKRFFQLKTPTTTHPRIRELTVPLFEKIKRMVPDEFKDVVMD